MISVLVIEDDDADSQTILRMLRADDVIVKIASNMQAALNSIARETPHVVFLDLNLPDVDPIQAIDRLVLIGVPPIVVTGAFEEVEVAEKALDAGAVDYVFKDHINPELLIGLVRKFFDSPSQPRITKKLDWRAHHASRRLDHEIEDLEEEVDNYRKKSE